MKNILVLLISLLFVSSTTFAQDKYMRVLGNNFWVDTSAYKILKNRITPTKEIVATEESHDPSYDEFQVIIALYYLADHELETNEVANVILGQENILTKTKVNMFLTKFGEAPTVVMVKWMPINKKWFVQAVNAGLICSKKGDRIFHGPNVY